MWHGHFARTAVRAGAVLSFAGARLVTSRKRRGVVAAGNYAEHLPTLKELRQYRIQTEDGETTLHVWEGSHIFSDGCGVRKWPAADDLLSYISHNGRPRHLQVMQDSDSSVWSGQRVLELRSQCKSEKLEDLCAWLKQIGVQGVDGLRLGASTKVNGGLAAFATKDFAPGEVVCFVPEQGILAGVRQQGLPKEACLARALLREKELKSESFFAPYINCLPTAQELPSIHPYFWPPELEMENLMAGSVHGQRVAKEILAEGRENVDCLVRTGISEQDARWALAIVDSRAFTFQPDSPEEQLALVPLVDILNTTSLFKDGVQLWQCSFEPHGTVKEGALLLAEGPVKEGEELLHLYGPNSSATLWMVYGFLENGGGEKENVENLFEICGLEVDVPAILVDDPPELKSSKLEALSRGDLPERLVLELPSDAQLGGKMMPLARLLSCQSQEEVNRFAGSLNLTVPDLQVDLQRELLARRLVVQWLRKALQDSFDVSAVPLPESETSQMAELQRTAKQLVANERPVLELELLASERFCAGAEAALDAGGASLQSFVSEQWDDETGWLGSGCGFLTLSLACCGAQVTAVDSNPAALALCAASVSKAEADGRPGECLKLFMRS
ncbi:LSMT-L [Symbiodinium natans]|uniref:LSMT-L protein n=1 Tax=Symbiodinium natans TaxID=878477 RepID=A0A812J2M7_9DINO|nr:LSMT-L [Symbiodinium natans]